MKNYVVKVFILGFINVISEQIQNFSSLKILLGI